MYAYINSVYGKNSRDTKELAISLLNCVLAYKSEIILKELKSIFHFSSLHFLERKRMFGLVSHVCCLRNYKYTPRHFQVKG